MIDEKNMWKVVGWGIAAIAATFFIASVYAKEASGIDKKATPECQNPTNPVAVVDFLTQVSTDIEKVTAKEFDDFVFWKWGKRSTKSLDTFEGIYLAVLNQPLAIRNRTMVVGPGDIYVVALKKTGCVIEYPLSRAIWKEWKSHRQGA